MKQTLTQILVAVVTLVLVNLFLSSIGWLLTDADITFKECARFPGTVILTLGTTILLMTIIYHEEGK